MEGETPSCQSLPLHRITKLIWSKQKKRSKTTDNGNIAMVMMFKI